jgi:hypothetical protein
MTTAHRGLRRPLARHLRLAFQASRTSAAIAAAAGVALPLLVPVTQAWLVAIVATSAAVVAVGLIAFGRHDPSEVADVEAALERTDANGLVAHALLRAALVLAALATGLALGGLLPNAQPA